MFAIANDRKSLWQWDLNQQLTVDGGCTEVHYLDRGAPSTLTVEVKDGKADIPNILLQKAGRLVVYAYIIDEQDHHTKVCETFGIASRPKPAEYVYTETEVKTWSDLQAQIGDLADLATDKKDNLVAAINEAAQSGGGGGAYTLPQATANVLGGVKADPATANDTQPVRISEDGKLVTAVEAGGKNSKVESWDGMELLASGTIASGTAAGTITDTGVTYGAFKQWHRAIFMRRCAKKQGNFSNGFGEGNNAGFRSNRPNLSLTFEHIDGYLWRASSMSTESVVYATPKTEINGITSTVWEDSVQTLADGCDVGESYIDIRTNKKNSFTDNDTFIIKTWAALTADVSWYIYGLTKEAAQ